MKNAHFGGIFYFHNQFVIIWEGDKISVLYAWARENLLAQTKGEEGLSDLLRLGGGKLWILSRMAVGN